MKSCLFRSRPSKIVEAREILRSLVPAKYLAMLFAEDSEFDPVSDPSPYLTIAQNSTELMAAMLEISPSEANPTNQVQAESAEKSPQISEPVATITGAETENDSKNSTKKNERSLEAKPRTGYGVLSRGKEFDPRQKSALMDALAVLDILFPGPDQKLFLTITLPSDKDECNKALAAWSGLFIDELFKWIRKVTSGTAMPAYRWEYQSRGALHCHLCVGMPSECTPIVQKRFKRFAFMLMHKIGRLAGVDMFSRKTKRNVTEKEFQCDVQIVEKSLAGYMSKYLSKYEKKKFYPNKLKMKRYPPSSLWGCSNALKKEVKLRTIEWRVDCFTREDEEKLERAKRDLAERSTRVDTYPHKVGPGQTTIYFLKPEEANNVAKRLEERFYIDRKNDVFYIEQSAHEAALDICKFFDESDLGPEEKIPA